MKNKKEIRNKDSMLKYISIIVSILALILSTFSVVINHVFSKSNANINYKIVTSSKDKCNFSVITSEISKVESISTACSIYDVKITQGQVKDVLIFTFDNGISVMSPENDRKDKRSKDKYSFGWYDFNKTETKERDKRYAILYIEDINGNKTLDTLVENENEKFIILTEATIKIRGWAPKSYRDAIADLPANEQREISNEIEFMENLKDNYNEIYDILMK